MKLVSAGLAVLLAAAALPVQADPAATPEQKNQVENCKILSGAVFEFAEARDKRQSKMAAFKNVTHGQNYVPGSLLDETLQWAYAHPDEQPDTTSAHFYGRCVLDAYDARNPDSEGELDIAAAACQQGHAGAPDAIRDCIVTKTQDIIANPPSAAVAAASSAAPAAATALASAGAPVTQAPSAATVVAVATPPPAVTAPQPVPAVPRSVPAAAPQVVAATPAAAVAVPAPSVPQPAPEPTPVLTPAAVSAAQPLVAQVQAPSVPPQEVTPPREPLSKTEVTFTAPAATMAGPVVAASSNPPAPPQAVVPPPAPVVAKPAPAPAPMVAKAAAPQPVLATSPPAVTLAPLPASRPAASAEFPPNLAGYGKLTVGMPMEDAYKALGSHGDTDRDAQGEIHTYMIGDDHGFMELRASSAGTLYSIRVVGGADAQQPPVMSVVLGDAAFILINAVGLPSSRTPLPGDKELWNYRDRNYAWEISPGGDVIGLRIIDVSIDPNASQ